jgi:hypothetical protein
VNFMKLKIMKKIIYKNVFIEKIELQLNPNKADKDKSINCRT